MDDDSTHGKLVIIEPFVPESDVKRQIQSVAPLTDFKPSVIFFTPEPLGWEEFKSNLMVLRPRYGDWETFLPGTRRLVVDGGLWSGKGNHWPTGFIAEYYPD